MSLWTGLPVMTEVLICLGSCDNRTLGNAHVSHYAVITFHYPSRSPHQFPLFYSTESFLYFKGPVQLTPYNTVLATALIQFVLFISCLKSSALSRLASSLWLKFILIIAPYCLKHQCKSDTQVWAATRGMSSPHAASLSILPQTV